jgi:cation:H+ antiporter
VRSSFIGGIALVTSAEAIAGQSGLGASFVGVTVLAAATSLPEISTTFAAVRLGAYTMAISNIFRLQPDHAGTAAAG